MRTRVVLRAERWFSSCAHLRCERGERHARCNEGTADVELRPESAAKVGTNLGGQGRAQDRPWVGPFGQVAQDALDERLDRVGHGRRGWWRLGARLWTDELGGASGREVRRRRRSVRAVGWRSCVYSAEARVRGAAAQKAAGRAEDERERGRQAEPRPSHGICAGQTVCAHSHVRLFSPVARDRAARADKRTPRGRTPARMCCSPPTSRPGASATGRAQKRPAERAVLLATRRSASWEQSRRNVRGGGGGEQPGAACGRRKRLSSTEFARARAKRD